MTSLAIDNAALRALDSDHHLHPFTDYKALAGEGGGRVMAEADGVHVVDAEGARYIDGMAGLWCVNVGYGRREIVEAAAEQMTRLPYYNTFFKTATPPSIELAAEIAGLLPDNFHRVFFANSGSEANDTVYRLVRRYWQVRGQPERTHIVSRINAYHGSTVVGASLGGMIGMHEQMGGPIPGIHHVRQPYWFDDGGNMGPEEFGVAIAHAMEEKIVEIGPEKVAAFIGEPVQGAGGVIIPPETYWPEVVRICREHDILLVSDEVICGFGRTGSWFGFETLGIEPDLVPMAKGLSSGYLPISAVAVSDRVAGVLMSGGGEFTHGFTYSGHPAACAAALANIAIIKREGLVERVRDEIGPYLSEALARLDDHPLVGETRSIGLLGAIELVRDRRSRARFEPRGRVGAICRDHCFDARLIMRACGDTMVLSPPLIIAPEQIDEIVDKARMSLDRTFADVRSELER